MSNKITEKTRQTVSEMFKNGTSKAEIARKCGISPRSVGRIIESSNQNIMSDPTNTANTVCLPVIDIKSIGDIDDHTPNTSNLKIKCAVQEDVRRVMEYVRREIKGIEALTYLIESGDVQSNLELYRKILVRKLHDIHWWVVDVEGVQLGIHPITSTEMKAIHNGEYGMK